MDSRSGAPMFEPVVVEPAHKAVSAAIECAIVEGSLPAGTAPRARLGVQRSSVREAIRSVEQVGLLQRWRAHASA